MVQEVKRSDGSRHFPRGDVYLSALDDSKVRFPTKLLKNASRDPTSHLVFVSQMSWVKI